MCVLLPTVCVDRGRKGVDEKLWVGREVEVRGRERLDRNIFSLVTLVIIFQCYIRVPSVV